jgi:hypothetical protein
MSLSADFAIVERDFGLTRASPLAPVDVLDQRVLRLAIVVYRGCAALLARAPFARRQRSRRRVPLRASLIAAAFVRGTGSPQA